MSDYNGDNTPVDISTSAGSSAIMKAEVTMLIIDDRATIPALDGGIVFFSTFVIVE